jgi:hypothetical protein
MTVTGEGSIGTHAITSVTTHIPINISVAFIITALASFTKYQREVDSIISSSWYVTDTLLAFAPPSGAAFNIVWSDGAT